MCHAGRDDIKHAGAAVTLLLSTLWVGFVLTISGMEAWLKFRAPFCPRPFALDIGRAVFPALNSMELAMCVSLWATATTAKLSGGSILIVPTAVLACDILFLTPKLVLRGKQVIYEFVKNNEITASKLSTDSLVFQELEDEMQGKPIARQDKWHIVYVFLECVKLSGLVSLIGNALSSI